MRVVSLPPSSTLLFSAPLLSSEKSLPLFLLLAFGEVNVHVFFLVGVRYVAKKSQ